MRYLLWGLLFVGVFCMLGAAQDPQAVRDLRFTPAEVESMLFLYNQTSVKGAEVELVAPVGIKLRAGLKEARALTDTTKTIVLKFNSTDTQICLGIIQNSTFEAKYAELVLGMKRKLEELLPPAPTPRPEGKQQEGG